jgi:hypothetical protein
VATAYGDNLRTWVVDSLNGMMPDYEWHDFAKI